MKNLKRALSLLLVLALVLTVVPATVLADDGDREIINFEGCVYSTADGKTLRLDQAVADGNENGNFLMYDALNMIPITEIAPHAFSTGDAEWIFVGFCVIKIDEYAFADSGVTQYFIPENVTEIAENAFPEGQMTIICYDDSYAETYAKEHGYVVESMPLLPFEDVAEDAWYYEYILEGYRAGLVNGMSDTTFEPNGTTTRAMVVQILFNLAGDEDFNKSAGFTDVPSNAWYAQAVNWAADLGVVNGIGDNKFDPNAPVTREQVATMLYRFADAMELEPTAKGNLDAFTDKNKVSNYALDAITWGVDAGLIKGMTTTTLEPAGRCTRAQVTTMMVRFLIWLGEMVIE